MKDIINKIKKLNEFAVKDIKTIVGVESVKESKQSFRDGGFDGKPWQARKNKNRKGKADTKVLTDSGDLGDSIDWQANYNNVKVGSDVKYAPVHNEGLQAGRPPGFKMPKRQFLGLTKRSEKAIKSKIDKEIKRILS